MLASRCLERPLGRRQLCTPHEAQHRKMLTDALRSSALLWVPISCLLCLSACCQACTGRNTKLIGVTVSLPCFVYLCRKFSSEFLSLELVPTSVYEQRWRIGNDCKVNSFVGSSTSCIYFNTTIVLDPGWLWHSSFHQAFLQCSTLWEIPPKRRKANSSSYFYIKAIHTCSELP